MFTKYFAAAAEHLLSIGQVPCVRVGDPVSVEQLAEMERIIKRPIPSELRAYYLEMGDNYRFSPTKEQEGCGFGFIDDCCSQTAVFVEALRYEARSHGHYNELHAAIEGELARREQWFPFYGFGNGGYMYCLDLNESPAPVRYYERVYWPGDTGDWGFRLADSFLDLISQWSRFCFSAPDGGYLNHLGFGASEPFDWAASHFDPLHDRGTTLA